MLSVSAAVTGASCCLLCVFYCTNERLPGSEVKPLSVWVSLGKRKAIKALILCSSDESAEVRFWCVFALGQYRWHRNKPRLEVVRALEARLQDDASPDARGNWWTVGLEALAMLCRASRRHFARELFREAILRVLRDPLRHPGQWRWADWYVSDLHSEPEVRDLFDAAMAMIQEAGFDTVSFGQQKTV